MDLLAGTPYLLDNDRAARALEAAQKIDEEVRLLRRSGALDSATLARLRSEWGFRQVHESAAIEGNQLTLNETQIAIQRGITISGKPPEHSAEVQNLFNAIQYAESLAKQATPISEREIREMQSLIVGKEHPEAGAYRSVQVHISNSPHTPPHPLKVPEAMTDYAHWLADSSDVPVPLSCSVAHAWLVHIHPFRDGNGRTARAVSNLQLIRAGYPIVVIRRKDRQRYYEALRCSDEGDITPFLTLILDRCQDSLKQIDRIRKETVGLTLAIEKVLEADHRKYEIWAAGIRLFATTFAAALKSLEEKLGCVVAIQEYDMPTADDYQLLTQGLAEGNTWLMKATVKRGGVSRSLLLWIGFSSCELTDALKTETTIPAIKVSQPNDHPPPQWVGADSRFPSTAREFAYSQGRYHRLNQQGAHCHVTSYENVEALALQFVRELIEGWFATTPAPVV